MDWRKQCNMDMLGHVRVTSDTSLEQGDSTEDGCYVGNLSVTELTCGLLNPPSHTPTLLYQCLKCLTSTYLDSLFQITVF